MYIIITKSQWHDICNTLYANQNRKVPLNHEDHNHKQEIQYASPGVVIYITTS